jgi:predicted nucleotidyltransferase
MLNLTKEQRSTIVQILLTHVPECEVRVFGSRLTGKSKSYSDLDLAVVGKEKIPRQKMIKLKEALQNSKLPFRVDLLDWHRISDNFKKIIQNNYQVLITGPAG